MTHLNGNSDSIVSNDTLQKNANCLLYFGRYTYDAYDMYIYTASTYYFMLAATVVTS